MDNPINYWYQKYIALKAKMDKMMREAVEGVVCYGSKGAYVESDFLGTYDTEVYGKPGDKVRIIVLPKEN